MVRLDGGGEAVVKEDDDRDEFEDDDEAEEEDEDDEEPPLSKVTDGGGALRSAGSIRSILHKHQYVSASNESQSSCESTSARRARPDESAMRPSGEAKVTENTTKNGTTRSEKP